MESFICIFARRKCNIFAQYSREQYIFIDTDIGNVLACVCRVCAPCSVDAYHGSGMQAQQSDWCHVMSLSCFYISLFLCSQVNIFQ